MLSSAFSGHGFARLAATTLVSGAAVAGVLAAGGAAVADDVPQQAGATATIGSLTTAGAAVLHDNGVDRQISAGLFEMSVDGGGMLQTYGADVRTATQKDAQYHETPWSGTSLNGNPDAGKIRWILRNSYPQVNDLAALARKAGASGLTEQDAAAGTQVAIWRYSDGADVEAVSPAAEKLADHLQKSARNLPEPVASLTLDSLAVAGQPGQRLGPVTVHTDADTVTVTPPADAAVTGVRIVDGNGQVVTSTIDGGQLWFDVPQDAATGAASLTVQASTTVPVGRAFTSDTHSQTQILAGSSESTVSATATANWARQGAIPALSAERNCTESGVDITAVNQGDEPFTFELMGVEHTVAAHATQTVRAPLQEDQPYDFTITGPNDVAKRFRGVLDCRTESATAGDSPQTLGKPSPASAGGTAINGTDLAETGSSEATPLIAGIAIALVMVGATVVVLLRKKQTPPQS